jgi:ribosomal protein S18 acetylase RimI-like enzyme
MPDLGLRQAVDTDAAVVLDLLAALARDIGDAPEFRSTAAALRRHGFGPGRLFHATLAFCGGMPAGLALYFPTFSTTRGAPGAYVQDLFVAAEARGLGLGQRLLQAVSREAEAAWGATHLTLTVYGGNTAAQEFYRGLGFVLRRGEIPASLDGPAFAQLRDRA